MQFCHQILIFDMKPVYVKRAFSKADQFHVKSLIHKPKADTCLKRSNYLSPKVSALDRFHWNHIAFKFTAFSQ